MCCFFCCAYYSLELLIKANQYDNIFMLILYLLKKGSKGVDLIRVKVYNKVSRKVIKKKVEVPNKNFYLFLFLQL